MNQAFGEAMRALRARQSHLGAALEIAETTGREIVAAGAKLAALVDKL